MLSCFCCFSGDQRSRRRRLAAQAAEAEAAIVRASLGFEEGAQRVPHGLSVGDRRDFVSNVLLTRHVVAAKDVDEETSWTMQRSKSDLLISASRHVVISPTTKEQHDHQEAPPKAACPICLTDYVDGDEICWSHNERCNHVFHRECIVEWLIHHDECPCCRMNFLCLHDDAEGEEDELQLDQSSSVPTVGDDDEESFADTPQPSRGGLSLFRSFGTHRSHGQQRPEQEGAATAPDPPEVSRVGTSETETEDYLDQCRDEDADVDANDELQHLSPTEGQAQDDDQTSDSSAEPATQSDGDESC